MTQDRNHPPADPDPRAGMSKAERQEKLAQLAPIRRNLSPEEAVILRVVFPDILDAHHEQVWDHLRRCIASRDDARELYQDVFLALHNKLLEGFPDSLPGMVGAITKGKISNYIQAQSILPTSVALPSSASEPGHELDLDRAMDLRELAQRVLPQLSPEFQEVTRQVILNELSYSEAAEVLGLTEAQVKGRLVSARRVMFALAEPILPSSQRDTP